MKVNPVAKIPPMNNNPRRKAKPLPDKFKFGKPPNDGA
jgi:hypothetical protein